MSATTTFAELEEVIWREKFDRYFSTEKRQNFLNNMRRVGLFYEIGETVELCRDKKDNPFLDVALAGKADCLITGDADLYKS
ncbi:MAG: putative toxin-antitoxin system toxin component, PIN family [Candidatus Thiothrix putei]|uniref:Toxin-antitoxin system toxin component, PIN family n=1 Tax=Candidatus Thiothrix putei TaxID=3080811 RepID=A0AA95HFU6_9GAMM|nr:MAG: putative toxin-antitoxin system toxin component, PIN family [Candidatus Thiothrix putei]